MIASLWLADVGRLGGLFFRPPKPGAVDGLRFSSGGVGSELRTSHVPRVTAGRAAWFAVWEDEAALSSVGADPPKSVAKLAGGCRIRLEPIRAYEHEISVFGTDLLVDTSQYRGPVIVVTVNKPRLLHIPKFLAASVPAERAALERDDMRWSMGYSRPPMRFATITVWDSGSAAAAFALGAKKPEHSNALAASEGRGWFAWNLTVRCRPISVEGSVGDGELRTSLLPVSGSD